MTPLTRVSPSSDCECHLYASMLRPAPPGSLPRLASSWGSAGPCPACAEGEADTYNSNPRTGSMPGWGWRVNGCDRVWRCPGLPGKAPRRRRVRGPLGRRRQRSRRRAPGDGSARRGSGWGRQQVGNLTTGNPAAGRSPRTPLPKAARTGGLGAELVAWGERRRRGLPGCGDPGTSALCGRGPGRAGASAAWGGAGLSLVAATSSLQAEHGLWGL